MPSYSTEQAQATMEMPPPPPPPPPQGMWYPSPSDTSVPQPEMSSGTMYHQSQQYMDGGIGGWAASIPAHTPAIGVNGGTDAVGTLFENLMPAVSGQAVDNSMGVNVSGGLGAQNIGMDGMGMEYMWSGVPAGYGCVSLFCWNGVLTRPRCARVHCAG